MRHPVFTSFLLATMLHAAVLFGWKHEVQVVPPKYGIAPNVPTVEVALVSEVAPDPAPIAVPLPDEPKPDERKPEPPKPEPVPIPPKPEPVPVPEPVIEPPPKVEPAPESPQKTKPIIEAPPAPAPARSIVAQTSAAPAVTTPPAPVAIAAAKPRDANAAPTGRPHTGGQPSEDYFTPSYLRNPLAPYPASARRAGHQGLVLLKVQVNEKGTVDSAEVVVTSGYEELDEAALKAVRRWRFKPAMKGNKPVPSVVEVPHRFELKKQP